MPCSPGLEHESFDVATKAEVLTRFIKRVVVPEDPSGCWGWAGPTMTRGYGQLGAFGRRLGAHRLSVFLLKGEDLQANLVVRHSCHNKSCVNPEHLIQGTYKENWADHKLMMEEEQWLRNKEHPSAKDLEAAEELWDLIL